MAVLLERTYPNKRRSVERARAKIAEEKGLVRMINAQSGRAAIRSTPYTMLDDDLKAFDKYQLYGVQRNEYFLADDLSNSHWKTASQQVFEQQWQAEYDRVPATLTNNLYLLTGALLPIWNKLPSETPRVVQLVTDDKVRLLGRILTPEDHATLMNRLSPRSDNAVKLKKQVINGKQEIHLHHDLIIRRSKIMDRYRLEVVGPVQDHVDALRGFGCFTEVINYQLRFFIPTDQTGLDIIASLTDHFGIKTCPHLT